VKPAALLLQLILHFSPAEIALQPQPHDLHETVDERRARMADIAADVWFVAQHEAPLGRQLRSAIEMLAVANVESHFSLDVDSFRCLAPRCDWASAFGILQAHAFNDEERDMVRTRRGALILGWRRMRSSMLLCRGEAAFANFLGAQCDDATALPESRKRIAEIATWREYAGRLGAP
jgi:hypothetical protein